MRVLGQNSRPSFLICPSNPLEKLPPPSSCPQSQSSSIVSPVPSHEALQYLPPGCGGQVQVGFLHVFLSSAIRILRERSKLFGETRVQLTDYSRNLGCNARVVFEQSDVRAQ